MERRVAVLGLVLIIIVAAGIFMFNSYRNEFVAAQQMTLSTETSAQQSTIEQQAGEIKQLPRLKEAQALNTTLHMRQAAPERLETSLNEIVAQQSTFEQQAGVIKQQQAQLNDTIKQQAGEIKQLQTQLKEVQDLNTDTSMQQTTIKQQAGEIKQLQMQLKEVQALHTETSTQQKTIKQQAGEIKQLQAQLKEAHATPTSPPTTVTTPTANPTAPPTPTPTATPTATPTWSFMVRSTSTPFYEFRDRESVAVCKFDPTRSISAQWKIGNIAPSPAQQQMDFFEILNKANVVYYAFDGSLLGAYRNKGPIPCDLDVDVLIPVHGNSNNLERSINEIVPTAKFMKRSFGFVTHTSAGLWADYMTVPDPATSGTPDFHSWVDWDDLPSSWGPGVSAPADGYHIPQFKDLLPCRCDFGDTQAICFDKNMTVEYLSHRYGPTYMVPHNYMSDDHSDMQNACRLGDSGNTDHYVKFTPEETLKLRVASVNKTLEKAVKAMEAADAAAAPHPDRHHMDGMLMSENTVAIAFNATNAFKKSEESQEEKSGIDISGIEAWLGELATICALCLQPNATPATCLRVAKGPLASQVVQQCCHAPCENGGPC